ncbi:MAG: hypothetical protein DRH56_09075 [Deltaproteobacteria bacterium]|nr:MAG: hypothetical protein DRH56_09075 [Deltaproteobacteria bacterium]
MEKKRAFEPGDMVRTFTGQAGMVIPGDLYPKVRAGLKEKRRPGYYFAPGCCQHPDYVIQVPVLFEDGTFDVMRSINIRKAKDLPEETRRRIEGLLAQVG